MNDRTIQRVILFFAAISVVLVIVTVLAFNSPFYRRLSAEYAKGAADDGKVAP